MILTVTLNPAIDRTVKLEKLALNKILRVERSFVTAGGKGINAARVLKLLGAEVKATGLLGGTAGMIFRKCLGTEGIRSEFTEIRGETRQNITLIGAREKFETHLVERGPEVNREETEEFMKQFNRLLKGGSVGCVVISGSVPPGMPAGIYAGLTQICRKKKVKVALDTSGIPLKHALKSVPQIFKPNKAELLELSGAERASRAEMVEFSFSLGVPEVLITMGKDGMLLTAGKNAWRAVPPKIKAVNSVGSGDALLAGYIYSRIIKGEGFEEAMRLGTACALANCVSESAASMNTGDIYGFFGQVKIQRIH